MIDTDYSRSVNDFRRCLQYLGSVGSEDFDPWVALLRILNAVDLLAVELCQDSRLSFDYRESLGLRAVHLHEAEVITADVKACLLELSLLRNISAHAQEVDRTNFPNLGLVLERARWLFSWYLTQWRGGKRLSVEEAEKVLAAPPAVRVKPVKTKKVFICYAVEDFERVVVLHASLKARGHQPWLDKMDLLPGQEWESEIRKAIQKADCFLACMSRTSVSKRGYVQKEVRFALDVLGEVPAGRIYLIPVRFEPCDVPATLEFLHWIDLEPRHSLERLFKAVEHSHGEAS